jgi:hypothetical protein
LRKEAKGRQEIDEGISFLAYSYLINGERNKGKSICFTLFLSPFIRY